MSDTSRPTLARLRTVGVLRGVEDAQLEALASLTSIEHVEKHVALTVEGEPSRDIVILLEGMAQVRRGTRVLAYLGDGDLVAAPDTAGQRASVTVTAIVPTEVLRIVGSRIAPLRELAPDLAQRLFDLPDRAPRAA